MKTFINNFAAFAAVISFVLLVEFVKALGCSNDERRYKINNDVRQKSNSASDPTYPLPAMRLLQIW
jgi:hypothetical protein